MYIYYVNLDKDTKRREFMEAQLSKIGQTYERVPGIYGRELSKKDLDKYYSKKLALRKQSRELYFSEIGCALSHVNIYQKIVEQNLPYAMILEDDVVIPENFDNVIANLVHLIRPEQPEILLLSPAHGDFNQLSRIRSSGEFKAVPFVFGFYTSSYIVTQTAARSLIKEHTPLGMVIDNWKRMNDFKVADFYVVSPCLIMQDQDAFGSSTNADYKPFLNLFYRLSYKVRRIRCKILDFFQSAWRRRFHPYNDVLRMKK